MATRQVKSQVFGLYGQSLMGVAVVGLFTNLLKEATTLLSHHLCPSLTGEFLNAVLYLVIGEGRLLAAHILNFQRLLDCYCMLASVVPLLHCILNLQ